jgi:hypothetical protein
VVVVGSRSEGRELASLDGVTTIQEDRPEHLL